MNQSRYIVYSSYTAGLRFAEVARDRGHEVRLVHPAETPFAALYQERLPGLLIPFHDLQNSAVQAQIAAFRPDFLVSCVFDRKVPTPHFTLARREAVNIHPSRLPAIRTGDSSFWNIMLEDDAFILTMHRLTDRFDAGEVLFAHSVPLDPHETRLSLISKVERTMVQRAGDFQKALEEGACKAEPQAQGSFYPKPRQKRIALGLRETAAYLDRLVRAAQGDIEVGAKFRGDFLQLIEIERTSERALRPPGTLSVAGGGLVLHTTTEQVHLTVLGLKSHGVLGAQRFIDVFTPQDGETLQGEECAAAQKLRLRTEAGWSKGSTT